MNVNGTEISSISFWKTTFFIKYLQMWNLPLSITIKLYLQFPHIVHRALNFSKKVFVFQDFTACKCFWKTWNNFQKVKLFVFKENLKYVSESIISYTKVVLCRLILFPLKVYITVYNRKSKEQERISTGYVQFYDIFLNKIFHFI